MKYAEYNHNIMVWLKHIFILIFLFIVSILPNISSLESCKENFCEPPRPLEPHEPSIFIIHAAGRLGNHLMAFAIGILKKMMEPLIPTYIFIFNLL